MSEPPTPLARIENQSATDEPAAREPEMLALFRALPKRAQHQFLQLALNSMDLYGPVELSADTFLAIVAWEIEGGDDDRANELYPQGCEHREIWIKHTAECARDLIHCERYIFGRVGMLTPFVRVSDTSIII